MKILSIEFENLNSLIGRTKIAFTDPVFTENGIFAIVGPTGSGKTTILDAICLALYGRTPRLGKITGSENEIMSRHAGSCFAEVVFETNQFGRFLCRWSQRRARNQSSGNLQNPTHEIAPFDDTTKQWGTPLETRLSLVPGIVEDKTGMDFDRFTRSMLLAQGEFARFLQSNEEERGRLLEQITGTDIYGRISQSVFERTKEEKATLDRIGIEIDSVEVFDEETRLSLQNEIFDLEKREKPLQQESIRIGRLLQSLDRIEELSKSIERCQIDWLSYQKTLKIFEPKKMQLHAALRAGKSESLYNDFLSLTKQQDQLKEKIESYKAQELEAEQRFSTARSAEIQAKSNLEQAEVRHKTEGEIIETVQALDVQIASFTEQIGREEEAFQDLQKTIDDIENDIKAKESELARFFKDSSLLETEQLLRRQNDKLNNLLAGKKLSEMFLERDLFKQERENWVALSELLDTKQKHHEISCELASEKEQLNKSLEFLENQIKEQHTELKHAAENAEHLEVQLKLFERISRYEDQRRQLEDGTPCPLCGATEHPYAKDNIPTPDAVTVKHQETRNEQKRLETEITKLELEQIRTTGELKRLVSQIENENSVLLETEKSIFERTETLKLDSPPQQDRIQEEIEGRERQIRSVEKKIVDIERLQKQVEELKHLAEQARVIQAEIEKRKPLLALRKEDRERRKNDIESRSVKKAELVDQRLRLFGDKDTATARKNIQDEIKKLRTSLEAAASDRLAAETNKAKFLERKTASEENLKNTTSRLDSKQNELRTSCRENGFASLEDFEAARLDSATVEQLQQDEISLQKKEQELKTLREKYETELKAEKEKQEQSAQASDRNDLEKQKEKIEGERKTLLERIGSVKTQLKTDEESSEKKQEALQRFRSQEKEYGIWQQLNHLIGSSDGKKFRTFAQGLTFHVMLDYANRQLQKMSDRYLLVQDESAEKPLELRIMDAHQAGVIRSTKNLSGGESFLVSLALALGLSSMASRNVRVDSLFLDEGFGTLDEQSLDTALTVLEGLRQQEGKLIGIISHVSTIRERIPAQIRIQPQKEGRSNVQISFGG